MEKFTYNDYIKCIHAFRLNAVMKLAEDSAEYRKNKIKNEIETKELYKQILINTLKDKKEMKNFLNDYLYKKEKIQENDLILYDKKSNKNVYGYEIKQPDILYKLRNKEIYIFIVYQFEIDHHLIYKILNYCINIMKEWNKNRKIGSTIRYPIIIPIVIYFGERKWNNVEKTEEKKTKITTYRENKLNLAYNFININKISEKTLIEKNEIFSKYILIQKSKKLLQLEINIQKSLKYVEDENTKQKLLQVVNFIVYKCLNEKNKKELKRYILQEREDGMEILIERLKIEKLEEQKEAIMNNYKNIKEVLEENNISQEIIQKIEKITNNWNNEINKKIENLLKL